MSLIYNRIIEDINNINNISPYCLGALLINLISYTFDNNLIDKYDKLIDFILSHDIYSSIADKIIIKSLYNEKNLYKLVNYYKNKDIYQILSYQIDYNNNYKIFDFIFSNVYDINVIIEKYFDKLVNNNHKWNLWKTIDNTIITYLSKYIFINNIEYDFTKIEDLKKYNLYVEFIKNNDIKSSYTLFNKLLNDHINNIYIMNSAGKTLKSFSNADGLIINIIKKEIKIVNVDIILKYLEVNYDELFKIKDKVYRMNLYRLLDKSNAIP
jgi:hypothetical protein